MSCPNTSHPDWLKLVNKVGITNAYIEYINNDFDIPESEEIDKIDISKYQVKASMKSIEILLSDKAKQVFEKGKKNNWDLNKILTELQVPKEQKQLILNKGIKDREELLTSLVADNSFVVEINTAKVEEGSIDNLFGENGGQTAGTNTNHYSNLTVPGGTNYTENEIATPNIVPSIKGHAQFATDNGIGWFRSDDKATNKEYSVQDFEDMYKYEKDMGYPKATPTKTRRILEVQSDLFQKGRDSLRLTKDSNEYNGKTIGEKLNSPDNQFLQLLNKDNNWVTFFVKSIIQDSAKKGYEKVLFPTGNTASKVEGHTTLEEFKIQKLERLKELKKEKDNILENSFRDYYEKFSKVGENYFREHINLFTKVEITKEEYENRRKEVKDRIVNEAGQIKKELERVEKEGFAALKPIYNFYENTVANILNKTYGKENVKLITDEYGNTWSEITVEETRDSSDIFFQQESKITEIENDQLTKALQPFLKSLGVTLKQVSEIKDKDGNSLDVVAVADISAKLIQIVEGKASKDTLTEEASHFLVELLEASGNPLFKSMFNDIESFDIYKETYEEYKDIYKGDKNRIKKEAMGKLITQIALEQFEQSNKLNRANNWFNKVLNYLKELFSKTNKQDLKPFSSYSEAAKMLFKESTLENDIQSEEQFFQLSDKQKEITDKLDNTPALYIKPGSDRYTVVIDGKEQEVKSRTSDLIKAKDKQRGFTERSPSEQIEDSKKAFAGTNGHEDASNILARLVGERDGTVSQVKVVKTNEAIYSTLETYLKNFVDSIPKDSKIYTELKIYDAKRNSAGTIDLLIIDSDGTAHILDFKFIDLSNKNKVPEYKKENFNIQIGDYKRVLKDNYGVTKFGQTRIIPVSAIYDKNTNLIGIKIGNVDAKLNTESILNPIPVDNELTGIDSYDKLLKTLYEDRDKIRGLTASKVGTELQKEKARVAIGKKLENINQAIEDILLKQELTGFITDAENTLKRVSDLTDYSHEQLSEFYKTLEFFSNDLLGIIGDIYKVGEDDFKNRINNIVVSSQIKRDELKNRIEQAIVEVTGDVNANDPQKEGGLWTRMFRTISQQNHPLIKGLYKLVNISRDKTKEKVDELLVEIEEKVKALKDFQKGKTGEQIFDFMLKKASNGKLNLIAKYSSSYYKERDAKIDIIKKGSKEEKRAALKWIADNINFDTQKYNETLANKKQAWNEVYKYDVDKDAKIADRVKSFQANFSSSEFGLTNRRNPFITPKDTHQSSEYQYIQQNKPLKDFYDLWTENTKMFQQYVGISNDPRMVWNVQRDLIDSIMANGASSAINISTVFDNFKVKSGRHLGMVDEKTGKPIHKIPVFYNKQELIKKEDGTYEYDSKNQSTDLGRVLGLVAHMAYNYKHMEEIEASAKLLEIGIKTQEAILTDGNGNKAINKFTDKVQTVIGSASNLEQFQDYFNYYVYGVKNKTQDIVFDSILGFGKEEGTKYSALAIYGGVKQYFSGKSLAFNPISIMANITGGNMNARILGAKNKYFNNTQYSNALYNLMPRNDAKSFAAIGFFDLVDGDNFWKKSNDLSVNFLTRNLTFDKLLIGQEAGDKLIRNSVLLAMMQSHTVDENGNIIKITEEKKGAETLYDKISIENGKFSIQGVSDEVLTGFRRKALTVGDTILGSNNRDDIRSIQLTVLGKSMMMFRSWIPRMMDERYGELRHNGDLQTYEMGRYRSFFEAPLKQYHNLIYDSIRGFGLFGYGGTQTDSARDRAKFLYEKAKEKAEIKGDKFDISEEEFIQLHYENLRANAMEIYVIGTMMALIMALKGFAPDEDKDKGLFKYAIRQMERNMSELSFFLSLDQFNKIIKSPLPITRVFSDAYNLSKTLAFEGVEGITGDESLTKPNDLRKYGFKVFPIGNGIETLFEFMDDDYNKRDVTNNRGR